MALSQCSRVAVRKIQEWKVEFHSHKPAASVASETTNFFKMPSCTRALFLLSLNLVAVFGATLPSDPRIQKLATRMDVIGIINRKVIAGDISRNVQQGTAQAYCQSNNGTVVIIESGLENDLILDYMVDKKVNYFWTDLSDYSHEGTWAWTSSGLALGPTSYANWADGEPAADPLKNCVVIDSAGFWSAQPCTQPNGDSVLVTKALCQLLLQ